MPIHIPSFPEYTPENIEKLIASENWIKETATIDTVYFGIAQKFWDYPGFECLQLGIDFDSKKKQAIFYLKLQEDMANLLRQTNSISFKNLQGRRIEVYSQNTPDRLSSIIRCFIPLSL